MHQPNAHFVNRDELPQLAVVLVNHVSINQVEHHGHNALELLERVFAVLVGIPVQGQGGKEVSHVQFVTIRNRLDRTHCFALAQNHSKLWKEWERVSSYQSPPLRKKRGCTI
ncbi:hypothetical protein AMAG_19490 [Allomyces macrogynus ATCC 38327]|uniref:Uncharacterized protein n=1 Tax=Allomyces macrogynus (strain ATCC 38327) TaxID=578462 RepID=A0A0L0SSS1_ALLM3|nr:hypothetical protein AMAG_19490 [Allomyces macrogynus ATCC 38327]|eukprot:KNE65552.1 hypothetical protein AMAG_19490 [Allomyces macrogynus ATCC 38327]